MTEVHLPGYEILELTGEGGMATVWKARQTRLDRHVAIKMLKYRLAKGEEDYQLFLQESRAAARINHPSIIQVYDAGEYENMPYYVMEYVPGNNLFDLLQVRKCMEEKDVITIALEVARALDYCWNEFRMIHCDIKPDNIIIHDKGMVKLADLGLAKILGYTNISVDDKLTVGTPNYISPEQADGLDNIDFRTDIYSTGATLYHLVTGVPPFDGREDQEIAKAQIDDFLADPMEINPTVSSNLANLIEKLMVKNRSQRYESWAEVIKDLERVRNGAGVVLPMPAEGTSTVKRCAARAKKISDGWSGGDATQKPAPKLRFRPVDNAGNETNTPVTGGVPSKNPEVPGKKSIGAAAAYLVIMLLICLILYTYTFISPLLTVSP